MSDLYLNPTADGGELIIENGKPQMTSGLENSVYLSLFVGDWWSNSFSGESEKYSSRLTDIMNSNPLTLESKNDVIEEAKRVLSWMKDEGIADEILITAEINSPGVLYIAITITQPQNTETFKYALNWAAQEASLL